MKSLANLINEELKDLLEIKKRTFELRYGSDKKRGLRPIKKILKAEGKEVSHETVRAYDFEIQNVIFTAISNNEELKFLAKYLDVDFISLSEFKSMLTEKFNDINDVYTELLLSVLRFVKCNESIYFSEVNTTTSKDELTDILKEIKNLFMNTYTELKIEDVIVSLSSIGNLTRVNLENLLNMIGYIDVVNNSTYLTSKYSYNSIEKISYRIMVDSQEDEVSLDSIVNEIRNHYKKSVSKESIRNAIQSNPKILPIGKNSLYTISQAVKVDSIYSLIVEALIKTGSSMSIDEIYIYVQHHRNAVEKNTIISTISNNMNNLSRLIDGKVILNDWSKRYKKELRDISRSVKSEILLRELIEILNLHGKMSLKEITSSIDTEIDEQNLYNFLKRRNEIFDAEYITKDRKRKYYKLRKGYEKKIQNPDIQLVQETLRENGGELLQKDLLKKLGGRIKKARLDYIINRPEFIKSKLDKSKYNVISLSEVYKSWSPIINEFTETEELIIHQINNAIIDIEKNPTMYYKMKEPELSEIIKNNASRLLNYKDIQIERETPGGYANITSGEIDFYLYSNVLGNLEILAIGENKFYGNKDYYAQMTQDIGYMNKNCDLGFNILLIKDDKPDTYQEAVEKRDKIVEDFSIKMEGKDYYKTKKYEYLPENAFGRGLKNVKYSTHYREDIQRNLKYVHFTLHLDRSINRRAAFLARN